MFGKFMNNYYYGKSGQGDYRKEDMPETRMQLFKVTLRTRLSALFRLNLLYVICWLPAIITIMMFLMNIYGNEVSRYQILNDTFEQYTAEYQERNTEPDYKTAEEYYARQHLEVIADSADYGKYMESMTARGFEAEVVSEEDYNLVKTDYAQWEKSNTLRNNVKYFGILILCIAITGPFTAGVAYVTRNWARDEHAFIWSDFKDAVKENWKVSLPLSIITGILPAAMYAGYDFYGEKAAESFIWLVPMILVGMFGFIWSFSITYMHPMAVTYDLKLKEVISNGVKLGIARLPQSIGIRLLHCVPALLVFAIGELFGIDMMICVMILAGYYLLIGFALSRFVTASYTNAVFDRFINTKIEGAKVNQGLNPKGDDEEDDEEETEE